MNEPHNKDNFLIEVTPEVLDELKQLYRYAENPDPYELHYSPYWRTIKFQSDKGETMTPTEQDKELLSKLDRLIIENQSYDGSIDISDQRSMRDEILELIIADRKRVALEAERAGHVHAAKALKHQAELLGGTPDYMLKQFDVHIERHKAQQEEV